MTRVFSEPTDYDCPFCKVAKGEGDALTHPSDIVYQDADTTAFVSRKWYPNNKAPVIIIPNMHFQDLFDLTPGIAASIHRTAQKIGRVFVDVYRCEGFQPASITAFIPCRKYFTIIFMSFRVIRMIACMRWTITLIGQLLKNDCYMRKSYVLT